jgi:hypothetical protein
VAKVEEALDCIERIKKAIGGLPENKEFRNNPRFAYDVAEVTLELNRLEEKIRGLNIPLDTKIRWNCEVPLKLVAIIGILMRLVEKCEPAEMSDFKGKISDIRSYVNKLFDE